MTDLAPDVELEPPHLDDSDDDFQYEEVEVVSVGDDNLIGEDLDSALRSLQNLTAKPDQWPAVHDVEPQIGQVTQRPEVVDDFIRNFLVKMGLSKTLEMFETEWYEMKATGRSDLASNEKVLDLYTSNLQLEDQLHGVRKEVEDARSLAEKASATWDKFRKERDFHRMHHKRVAQEKNKLILDMQILKKHYSMVKVLEGGQPSTTMKSQTGLGGGSLQPASRGGPPPRGGVRSNPVAGLSFPPVDVKALNLAKTFKGHLMSVSSLAMHPTKPIVVTGSDDKTWKMWHLPRGDLIMSGEGHTDWVAGVSFHPKGSHLASASGDSSVKLWSFEQQRCVATYTDHTQAVWGVAFHDLGDFVASCSLDHSARLWDVTTSKCRQSLRGHVDSVNEVCWQPFSSSLCTASSDKTVSIWDARTGLCTQTFYGHHNSVNCVAFNCQGTMVASTDADGIAKLWDVRMVAEVRSIAAGEHPLNKCSFDRSSDVLAVASDNGKVLCYSTSTGELLHQLHGHEDAVQAVVFDPRGEFMVSAASDSTFRLWS
ncbi:MAG: sperm-associated antigen 16 -like [Trebouxia sp. A1-2]|nr:MAG: sperm-associated antigen 16 -like [Trebouxia sp. A1-2]